MEAGAWRTNEVCLMEEPFLIPKGNSLNRDSIDGEIGELQHSSVTWSLARAEGYLATVKKMGKKACEPL